MLINTANYFDYISKIGLENLTPARREMHTTLARYTKDGQDWSIYNNLKDAIDVQFKAIESLYEKLQADKSEPKKETKTETKKEAIVKHHPATEGKKRVTEEEAHMAAVKLIEAYVKRGDSYDSIRSGQMGAHNGEFSAMIRGKKIFVDQVRGRKCNFSFPLQRIYNEIKNGVLKAGGRKDAPVKHRQGKKPHFPGKGVELVSPEVTFIKRFALLNGKEKNKQQVLNFIKAIQKAIVERKIRKKSKYAKIIQYIQSQLVKTYNGMGESIGFSFSNKDYMKYLKMAGAEYLLPSVRFIKSFINMLGQSITKQRANVLLEKITLALENKLVNPSDKYISHLKTVIGALERFLKTGDSPSLTEAQLNGLEGVLGACDCGLQGSEYSESYGSAFEGVDDPDPETPDAPRNTILNSKEVVNLKADKLDFHDKWLDFIGNPSRGFTMMIYGMPKYGKSYLAVDFAGYLARDHGRVLYVAREEGFDDTLQDKLREKEVAHDDLDVADHLPKDISGYDFVFLDSINRLGLSPKEAEKLEKTHPKISFIYIFQCLKDGKYRGPMEFSHNVDVIVAVREKGLAIQYGRYNQGGEMKIFDDAPAKAEELNGPKKKKGRTLKFDWTEPEYLNPSDWHSLKMIKKYYDKGQYAAAMDYAMYSCDTEVREAIPPNVWLDMGGSLTPSGEDRLRKLLADPNNWK